jgi:hypothetical protein
MRQTLSDAKSHNIEPATWQKHFQAICDAKRKHRETGEIVSAAKKAAKDAGIDMKVLKLTEDLAALESDEATERMRNLCQNMIWLGKPIGSQGELFPTPMAASETVDAEQQAWEASEAGYEAGRTGARRGANPFPPGSGLHVAWDVSWIRGQETIAADLYVEVGPPDDAAADGQPPPAARRARPPKKADGVSAAAH